jgi:hypothetical protein
MHQLRVSSSVCAFLVTGAVFVLVCIYGRLNFYRDPGSVFFDADRAFERYYSAHRESEAKSFRDEAFAALNGVSQLSSPAHWKTGSTPSLCAVLVTVGRETETGSHPLEVRTFTISTFQKTNKIH